MRWSGDDVIGPRRREAVKVNSDFAGGYFFGNDWASFLGAIRR